MGATTVTATILGVDNQPLVGAYTYFRLSSVGTDSVATSTIDRDRISAVTDSNGQFSQALWDNGDSGITSTLEVELPSGQRVDVIIPASTATIDLWDLIENYQVGTADPQLPTNEALFLRKTGGAMTGAITTSSTFDGRDVATDGAKLDGIEALADVTDTANVTAAGALMDSELASPSAVKATTGTFLVADQTKLDGIEALADVTDATNIVAAGGYIAGGTDVAIADGGTGASTEAGARANLEFQTNVTGDVTAVTVTSYTVLTTDHTLTVDDTAIGGNVTINLPAVATVGSGFTLTVKKTGTSFDVTIDGSGVEEIDGSTTFVLSSENSSETIRSNATGWDVISRFDSALTSPFDYVQFDTTPTTPVYTAGRVHWEENENTLEIGTGVDDVAIQVGQENAIRVRNSTGSTITNGSVVRVSGSTGNRPNIILAQADTAANAAGTIGIATHDIENNTDGFVTTSGLVRGLVTSSFSEGDAVYLSSTVAGGLTATQPTISVQIGFVTISHVNNGTVLVAVESHIPIYGSIYVDGGVTAQAIPTGATYTKSTAFTTNGNDSGGVADVANDKLILSRGAWHITASMSFSAGSAGDNFIVSCFLDGVEQSNLHFQRKIGTGGDVGSAAMVGIVTVDQDTEDLDVRIRHDDTGSENVTVVYANLNGHKISN